MLTIAGSIFLTYPRAGDARTVSFASDAFKKKISVPMKRNHYTGCGFDFKSNFMVAEVH